MTRYLGKLPVSSLSDQMIRPTEYAHWDQAHTRFTRREKDAALLQDLLETIPARGLDVPLTLGVSDRTGDVYVCDGHHRAVALRILHARTFPFCWYWIRNSGVQIEERPFPFYLLNGDEPKKPLLPPRTQKFIKALARDDQREAAGMHADDRITCHTHQNWAAVCEDLHHV